MMRAALGLFAVAAGGLLLGILSTSFLAPAALAPHQTNPRAAALATIYRVDHLDHRPHTPFDPTDADAAEDAATWGAAEERGYRWAEDEGVTDAKACEREAEAVAFRMGCDEAVSDQRQQGSTHGL